MKNMTRANFLNHMMKGAAGLACLPSLTENIFAQASKSHTSPNIVFIFADDLGWADLPCHGYKKVVAHGGWVYRGDLKMPAIDRMAREGTRHMQFYVPAAVCSPSRTGIMTGQFPGRLGIHDYLGNPQLTTKYVDPAAPTVTRMLQQNGYATAHFGKWHMGGGKDAPTPEEYGIDLYDPCNKTPIGRPGTSEKMADETIGFIRQHKNEPFYINVWLYDPHSALLPTEKQLEPYLDREFSPRWGDNLGALQVWYAVLTEMDKQIGRILDALDEAGLSENTVVIFSSDNGPEIGTIPFCSHYAGASSANSGLFRGVKRSLYEGGIREPFIVRWPGKVPAGRIDYSNVIGGVDFLPTICSLAGVNLPDNMFLDGEDMSTAILGGVKEKKKPLMWENRFPVYGNMVHMSPMLAIRDGRWKLLMNPDGSRIELYDIPNDPEELQNLAWKNSDIVKRLSAQVMTFHKELPPGTVHDLAGKLFYNWPEENVRNMKAND